MYQVNSEHIENGLAVDTRRVGGLGMLHDIIEGTSSSAMAERQRELGDFKKARVNGGTNNHFLKGLHKCLRCR